MVSFVILKFFSFRKYHLLIVGLSVKGVLFRKPSVLMTSRLFLSIRFQGLGLMFRPLIHLELTFVLGNKYRSLFIHLHVAIQFDQHPFLKIKSFLQFMFWLLYQKSSVCKTYVWVLNLIHQLINVSVFTPYHAVLITISL